MSLSYVGNDAGPETRPGAAMAQHPQNDWRPAKSVQ